jgi:hypothetical protein
MSVVRGYDRRSTSAILQHVRVGSRGDSGVPHD